jgi:hypothetical protein
MHMHVGSINLYMQGTYTSIIVSAQVGLVHGEVSRNMRKESMYIGDIMCHECWAVKRNGHVCSKYLTLIHPPTISCS